MKKLEYYNNLDLKDESEVFEYFIETLQTSLITWDYFVNWSKVRDKMVRLENEFNLLNTLIGKKNSEVKFIELIEDYPKVKQALSLLIAVRSKKLKDTAIADMDQEYVSAEEWKAEYKAKYFKAKRDLDKKSKEELLKFYRQSGLKSVFERKDIKNVQDYYFGVEVGLDTHARKNRSGNLMEDAVKKLLDEDFDNILQQPDTNKIKEKWGIDISFKNIGSNKTFDFAILGENKQIALIEANHFSTQGSKPNAISNAYRDYENFTSVEKVAFIWVTDGLGWYESKKHLEDAFMKNDYIFNLKMVSDGILKQVI
jgi:type II restriction enzyme